MSAMSSEVAPGVFRLVLPLGIHEISTLNAYLIADPGGDTLVDCGVYAEGRQDSSATGALADALAACGSSLSRLSRLVMTHAHVDHFGIAGEVIRHSDAELWMHAETERDLAHYHDPEEAVDTRMLMLADHGLYGERLTEASSGLHDWLPVMPSVATPTRRLVDGEQFGAGGRTWQIVHTPGHSPGHVCLWAAEDRLLCSGDHLLKGISPPVIFERGFDPDPMGSYLSSLERVRDLAPDLVLPGHGKLFRDGAARATAIEVGKQRRLEQVLDLVATRDVTVEEMTSVLFRRNLSSYQMHFAMAETLAYLAYHRVRGRVQRVRRRSDSVFVWRAVDGGPEVS
jgi:glyoxylase-like metal-dependent hydrolase (beta-lactamase superfamily II)